MPDPQVVQELLEQSASIRQELTEIVGATVAIGRMLAWAQDRLRPELYQAWLWSEFGWRGSVADAFIDAACNFGNRGSAFHPAAALELAATLAARSICARELIKARALVQAYRAIVKGEGLHSGSQKPHSSKRPRSGRIRGRVFRSRPRRDESTPDIEPEELE
jgi:hypothetical protein